MTDKPFYLHEARSQDDMHMAIEMFKAYASALGIDLAFQDFNGEMRAMPGKYRPPHGELLLARRTEDNEVVGCVGLRPLERSGHCEMKRLYVTPAGRGLGVGKALVDAVVDVARKKGHQQMRLDTLPSMGAAQALYRRVGFVESEKYYETPIKGTVFMALDL